MRGFWLGYRAGFAAVLGLCVLAAGMARAADKDEAARQRVLALNRVTGNKALDSRFKALLEDPRGSKRLVAAARSLIKETPLALGYYPAFIMGQLAEEFKDTRAAEAFYRICIDQASKLHSGRKLSQAYISLIALFFDAQKYKESAKVCKEFLGLKFEDTVPRYYLVAVDEDGGEPFIETEAYDPVRPYRPGVHRLLVKAIAKQGKFDEALKLVNTLVKTRPKDWLDLELKGWVFREAGQNKEAAKIYEEVIEQVKTEKELEAADREPYLERYRYYLSNIYADLNRIDKAAAQLKALLAKKPNDPTYNNDLGYIWADHDTNLDEAEKHIRKALEQDRKRRKEANPNLKPEEDRDNGAFLDSLGWVLYKQKRYAEAKKVLLKAVADKDNQHIEIYDHLGDVHRALEEKDKAIAAWKKGLSFVTPSKRDQDRKEVVQKKIEENQ
jgi:tetratricopeptide (TPR) repeat protein